ncbi:hypothetical protein PoB_001057400 [Plakobranchus ocellatus]|uniref:Uncharacterized protein n=1 Tax=Plakobranchus ocellatus TaxID=259542 RepID=A0AAV3YPV4_9GAST|nr:hypothetical protein PoB_001057400 [Plakobranchus ocellatus]
MVAISADEIIAISPGVRIARVARRNVISPGDGLRCQRKKHGDIGGVKDSIAISGKRKDCDVGKECGSKNWEERIAILPIERIAMSAVGRNAISAGRRIAISASIHHFY